MISNLQQGQKLLVLRYGKQIVADCIELHQKKIDEMGYCWFGKLGTVPSKKSINAMLNEDKPSVILYARGSAFICEVSEVAYNKPEKGYPEYYKTELFNKSAFPTVYFKLISIEPMNTKELEKFVVMSSGNTAMNTLMHSMTSFLFVSFGKTQAEVNKSKRINKEPRREKLTENDCKYRKEGKCGLKSCVNYQYECDRPANCIKQKR